MRRLVGLAASIAAAAAGALSLPVLAPDSFAAPPAGPARPGPGALTADQVAARAFAAGFRGHALLIAVAVAGAESGWVADAEGDRYPIGGCECHSHGLWQIRSCPERDPAVTYDASGCRPRLDRGTRAELVDPALNARAAYRLAMSPLGWRHWTVYSTGRYVDWLPAAMQGDEEAGP